MNTQPSPQPVPGNASLVIIARSRDGRMSVSETYHDEAGAEFAKEAYLFFGYTAAIFPLEDARTYYPELFA